ncbi:MAG: HAD-IIIA family hydrolase [Firmicutes bacterium]|nr:HAD-IIIA family hydrolase [Bacillota bacterium]
MKKYRAVLFDFDGTLIDTNGYIVDSWKYASEKIFGKMVFDVSYLATHFGTPLEFAVEETIKHYNIEGYSVEELCALYREYQKENPTKIGVPFEGITELLKELKEKGIKVGVVTSRTKPTTIAALELNEIDKYFDVIIAVEDTQIHKPLPEPALICCSRMGVDPEDALMVGDSKWDIACGNNAGCGSALVAWSFAQKAEGLEGVEKPDYVIEKAEEILKLCAI